MSASALSISAELATKRSHIRSLEMNKLEMIVDGYYERDAKVEAA
jgi:hypothetical protein